MSGTSGAGKRPEAYLPAATAPATGSGLIDRRGGGWVLRAAQRAAQPVPPKRRVLIVSGGRIPQASVRISSATCSSQNRMSISRYTVVAVVRCSRRPVPLAGA
jgi:hypothetical protein